MPIENADGAPVSTVMDETYKIAVPGWATAFASEARRKSRSISPAPIAPRSGHSVSLFGTAGRRKRTSGAGFAR